MSYSRSFPITVGSYKPGDNVVLTGKCVVDSGTYAADIVTNISDTNYNAASAGWVLVIYNGADASAIGSYEINTKTGTPNRFTLTDLFGGAVAIPDGNYDYRIFDPAVPNSYDKPCEAVVFTALPGSSSTFDIQLTSGQYVQLSEDAFVVGAVYSIGILQIINDASGGITGYLLGNWGSPGSAYIP